MTNLQTSPKHTLATRLFHHTSMILLAVIWVLVEFRDSLESAIGIHKALGVVFLLWVITRLLNAVIRPKMPPLTPPQPKWQIGLSHLVHFGLYACMLALPIVGVLMSVYGGRAVNVFGLFEIPVFVTPSREMASFYNNLHTDVLFPILLVLIGMHAGAALYHQFIIKDGLMNRMK